MSNKRVPHDINLTSFLFSLYFSFYFRANTTSLLGCGVVDFCLWMVNFFKFDVTGVFWSSEGGN